ncbi:MAG: glycosyltransferase family 4 protein [Candidatus Eisenbacteria bacterium]
MRITMFLFHTFRNDHRVLKEARSLIGAGHRVTLIALREDDSLPAESTEEGIRVIRLRIRRWGWKKGRYAEYFLRAALAGFGTGADVYHAHDLDTLLPASIASRLRRRPLVYDSHELFTETHFLVGREKERRIWSRIERALIGRARRIITVSEPIADELTRRYGVEPPRVIRNCPAYHPPPEPVRPEGAAPDEPILLCQGYMQKGRGLEALVGAMNHLSRGRLVLLGDGEMKEELANLVGLLELESRVSLHPAVPIEDLPPRTAAATLGFIVYSGASLNFLYALPNKFFEYLMAGVPVVASPLPEIVKLVKEHGVGRIVDPVTPENIAKVVGDLLDHPEELARMRENCLRAAKDLHWGIEERKLLEIYESLPPPTGN